MTAPYSGDELDAAAKAHEIAAVLAATDKEDG